MRKRALVIGLWIISCAIVFLSVLVAPPARGQEAGKTGWSPTGAQSLESDGEVVLTFTKMEPGRITYRTMDGDCSTHPPWAPDPGQPDPPQTGDCGRPRAQAPEDYGHVSGEMIFTQAGSRRITIPIVDDDIDEVNEPFMVRAAEGDGAHEQAWLYTAVVRIIDDDPSSSSGSSSPAQSSSQARTGSQVGTGGATPPPQTETRPTEASRPDRDAASTELRPGPGFELIGSDLVSGPAASARLPEDKGGITKTVFVVLAAVIVSGGGAWIWRLRSSW